MYDNRSLAIGETFEIEGLLFFLDPNGQVFRRKHRADFRILRNQVADLIQQVEQRGLSAAVRPCQKGKLVEIYLEIDQATIVAGILSF